MIPQENLENIVTIPFKSGLSFLCQWRYNILFKLFDGHNPFKSGLSFLSVNSKMAVTNDKSSQSLLSQGYLFYIMKQKNQKQQESSRHNPF